MGTSELFRHINKQKILTIKKDLLELGFTASYNRFQKQYLNTNGDYFCHIEIRPHEYSSGNDYEISIYIPNNVILLENKWFNRLNEIVTGFEKATKEMSNDLHKILELLKKAHTENEFLYDLDSFNKEIVPLCEFIIQNVKDGASFKGEPVIPMTARQLEEYRKSASHYFVDENHVTVYGYKFKVVPYMNPLEEMDNELFKKWTEEKNGTKMAV